MQDILSKITSLVNCKLSININEHRNYYETAKQAIAELSISDKLDFVGGQETIDKCIELDTIIRIDVYPSTPVGSYVLYHYDLDIILQATYDIITQ